MEDWHVDGLLLRPRMSAPRSAWGRLGPLATLLGLTASVVAACGDLDQSLLGSRDAAVVVSSTLPAPPTTRVDPTVPATPGVAPWDAPPIYAKPWLQDAAYAWFTFRESTTAYDGCPLVAAEASPSELGLTLEGVDLVVVPGRPIALVWPDFAAGHPADLRVAVLSPAQVATDVDVARLRSAEAVTVTYQDGSEWRFVPGTELEAVVLPDVPCWYVLHRPGEPTTAGETFYDTLRLVRGPS